MHHFTALIPYAKNMQKFRILKTLNLKTAIKTIINNNEYFLFLNTWMNVWIEKYMDRKIVSK